MRFSKDFTAQRNLNWMRLKCLLTEVQSNTRQPWAGRLLEAKNISLTAFQSLCVDFISDFGVIDRPFYFDAQGRSFVVDRHVFLGVTDVWVTGHNAAGLDESAPKTSRGTVRHAQSRKAHFYFNVTDVYACPTVDTDSGSIRLVVADEFNANVPKTQIVRPSTAHDNAEHFPRVIEAMDLLKKSGAEIRNWVVDGIHTIVGVMAADDYVFSQSDPKFRGRSIISVNQRPIDIAEMLVHEASHQHFFILQQISRLVADGSSETLYSPIASTQRPTIKVLLGYHAAANILHFYDRLIPSGGASQLTKRRDVINDMCGVFESELDRSSTLTPEGKFLRDGLRA
ncbi:MAG: aKG-HExxH-type peptide beta-hydroxylase [Litorimonas sp.]